MKNLIKRFVKTNRVISKKLVKRYPSIFGGPSYHKMFETIINAFATFPNSKNLMEIGGADRPLDLTKSSIVDGLDIAKIENAKKLYNNYYRQSVEEVFPGGYDLIYSM